MSNVLVTGGCGFIGSHLVDRLVKENHNVVVVDNNSTGKFFNKYAKHTQCDVSYLYTGFMKNVDIIYHLAAESRIQPSLKDPYSTIINNILGTSKICDIAHNVKNNCKVIYAGSCTAEEQYLNPYAFTKFKGEEICKMYNEIYGLKTAIARFFNVYGTRHYREGDHATVLGIFEKQYLEGKPLTITGDGEQTRDFIHVHDIVDALIKMSETDCDGEVYELGYGKSYSIKEIADMFNTKIEYIEKPYGEMKNARSDIYEAVNNLDWKPERKIEDYIKEFINEKH